VTDKLDVSEGRASHYAYCESVHAGSLSPWHIRELDQTGKLRLGGGITTNSLCGRVARGWDLNVPIAFGHDKHTCRDCLVEFRAAALRSGKPREDSAESEAGTAATGGR
jgi:hypothetical protein